MVVRTKRLACRLRRKGSIQGQWQRQRITGYGFMLTASDSAINGGGSVDGFRIKVWRTVGGATVFDN